MTRPVLRPLTKQRRSRKARELAVLQKRRKFAAEFIAIRPRLGNDAEAARQAAVAAGYKPETAVQLLKHPVVSEIIGRAFSRHLERAEINGESIMRYWYEIATCELPLPPVGPCRYCWGEDHQYQYTQAEARQALRKHTSEQLKRSPHLRVPWDDLGGVGFDKTKKPHPYCPECNGQGRNYVMVIDRDKLSPAQRQAIDEVRVHKDGSVSLKIRDRSRAMENLMQLMGMIQPRKPLEVLDPTRPIEENVDILLQTAIDQGLLNMQQHPPLPVIEHDGTAEQLADADAE